MTAAIQVLSKIPMFAELDQQALLGIAPLLRERTFAPGEVVIWEAEPCQAVYFMLRGVARVRRMSSQGREQVLAYLGVGDCFNLVPALDGGPNPFTVEALTEITLYTIPCEQFHFLLYRHREIVQVVFKQLAAEVRRLSDMVEELALHTVRTRLARFLLAQANGPRPPGGWTQEEIAARIGTVREMVGRTLRSFASEGLIRRQRGRVLVVNRQALEREAGAE